MGKNWPVAVGFPEGARLIRTAVDRPDYQDAYAMQLRPGMPRDPAAWTGILRDAFPIAAQQDGEALMEVSTAGLDAWASIVVDDEYVTLCSSVQTNALRSRLYWGVVKRIHPFMARAMMARTHRRLALAAEKAA
ncbi:DUF2867 domain-containing protein [Streptomyces olivochromogenes]|uniref:DUF2867 domain-containing protein n=1 Tax=Streptomyces olivochromogenes TaxID=1963 RepID=UPI001F16AF18|nr:DUF2867 domain-containing protein [Streptomyces olivochromogenes]MCF3130467.1 DUF2867 domain-containing protein [Streptomyces olivochromogenes]